MTRKSKQSIRRSARHTRWWPPTLGLAIAIASAAPRQAHADQGIHEVQGVELTIPEGWARSHKGGATLFAPTKYRGRAIEVIAIKAMPKPTAAALAEVLGDEGKLELSTVREVDREGTRIVVADGKVAAKAGHMDLRLEIVPVKDHAVMVMSFVKADSDPAVVQANTAILTSARVAGPRLSVSYSPPKAKGLVGAPPEFVKLLTGLIPVLDAVFRFPRRLPIKLEECGVINAFYSPAEHSIRICHELFDDLRGLFSGAKLAPQRVTELTQGTVTFAFFHEFGHALVGELALPITGKGEDAADELATLMLASAKDFGRKAALAGAEWFDLMASNKHKNNFADEHSLDGQRVVAIVCLLYGADKQYAALAKRLQMTPTRLAKCDRDYRQRMAAWNTLLATHMIVHK